MDGFGQAILSAIALLFISFCVISVVEIIALFARWIRRK
jgi:hypothetical protein